MIKAYPLTPALQQVLWHECDRLYARNSALYIQLQDKHHLNVNLLLLSQWLDNYHIQMSLNLWQQLHMRLLHHDQQTLIPYRQHRRACKNTLSVTAYQDMLKKELLLERQSQHYILTQLSALTLSSNHRTAKDAATHNLTAYLSLFAVTITDHPILVTPQ